MTECDLQNSTSSAIITAIEQHFIDYTSAYVYTAGGYVHNELELTWLYTGTPISYFNGVIRTSITTSDLDNTIGTTLAHFQTRQQPMNWWITPSTYPLGLAHHLEAHGLELGWQDIGMAIDLRTINETFSSPPGLTIECVEDEETMQDWLHVFGLGFGLGEPTLTSYGKLVKSVPLNQHPVSPFYLARLNGDPVATSALFCDHNVASLCEVCTIPAVRRQGVGTTISLTTLLDARSMGYRTAVLQASSIGQSIYRHLGFIPYCTFDAYCWRPRSSSVQI